MNKIIIYILLLTMIAGCERYEDVEVDVPYKPKIVTACFLQSQSTFVQIAVTRSLPVFNVEPTPGMEFSPEYITDATVVLQKGTNIYQLVFDPDQNLYAFDLPTPIAAGEIYDIIVTSGTETSKGKITIPGKVTTQTAVKFDSISNPDGSKQYRATLTCTLLDEGKHMLQFVPVLVYDSFNFDMMYTEGGATVDELDKGQTITKTFISNFSTVGFSPERFEIIIVNCDEGYSKNTSLSLNLWGGIGVSPFVDPAIPYTNMSGGIGIVGSYNMETKHTFNVK